MTVAEIWEKYEGKKIRLGTDRGSAFIWIGTVTDNFINDMVFLQSNYRRYFDYALQRAKAKVTGMQKYEKFWMQEPQAHANSLEELARAKENVIKAKAQRKGCTNILQREVVKEYQSLDIMSDVTIVIIKGYETGSAWFEDEFTGLFCFGKKRARRA